MRNGKGVRVHLLAALTAVAIVGLATGTAFADATWLQTINVAEAGGANQDLQFGVHPDASPAIDNGTGTTTLVDIDGDSSADEVERPPLPPAGTFDTRFSTNLALDLRDGTAPAPEHQWQINFQRAAGGNITLTWDETALGSKVTAAQLTDTFGGVLGIDQDMLATNTLTITNAAVTAVIITATSVDDYIQHTQLVVTGQPTTGNSGIALGAITVEAQDGGGNGAAGVAITATLTAGATGTLSGTTTATTAAGGAATFSGLIYTTALDPETITLTFTATDWQGNAINVATANIVVSQPTCGQPTLVALPAADADAGVENQTPLLQWNAGALAVSYQLDFGTQASGCESILDNEAVAGLSYQSDRLEDGAYCFRVQSICDGGVVSGWSANSNFDTIPTFGEWGLIFLIASMIGGGGWYLRRRVGSKA